MDRTSRIVYRADRRRGSKSIAQNDEEKKYIREYANTYLSLSRFILGKKRAFLIIDNAKNRRDTIFFLHLLQAPPNNYIRRSLSRPREYF